MWQWPLDPSRWAEEIWSCTWCHASTHVGGEWFEISRPPYASVERRWERAIADDLPSDLAHAFDAFDKTLCDIERASMSPSDHLWFPEQPNACGACRKAAVTIDERWPREMRGIDARISVVKRPSK